MNPFLRAHAQPLVGSALLHAVGFALFAVATWLTVVPKITPPAAIDAYLAHTPPARVPPPPTVVAPSEPAAVPAAAEPAAPAPAPESAAALAAREHALEAERQLAERQQADSRRLEHEAAERAATERARAAADDRRRAAAAAAEKVRKAVDARQRAARESDLAHQLDAEEHRLGAENSGLLARYVSELQARIERAWNRPPSAHTGLSCIVNVTQVPGGTVTDVRLGACNGDSAVQQSIVLAVYRASPLPAPPDPSLFDRSLRLVFAPND